MEKFPTSPDGTDWGMWGDKPNEQWDGVRFTALLEHGCRFVMESEKSDSSDFTVYVNKGSELARALKEN